MNENISGILDKIINGIDKSWNKDEVIRYVYISLGKEMSKNVKFFYSIGEKLEDENYSFNELKDVYDSEKIDSFKVICKSAAIIFKEVFDRIGYESKLVKTVESVPFINRESLDLLAIHHWFIYVVGENDRKYFLTLVPDLMNIQFGLPTEHFANKIDYMREFKGEIYQVYEGEEIDSYIMSDDELKVLDEKIGYIRPYRTVDKNGNEVNESEYDDVFLDNLISFIRKDGYLMECGYNTDFFKNAMSFEIDGLKIEDYLNSGNIEESKLELWLDYLRGLVKERFNENDKEYLDSLGKINGIKSFVDKRRYSKYRIVISRLAMNFVDQKYKIDEDGFCSTEYIKNKFEYLFPLMFSCNEENIPPITKRFNGFAEQLDFIDLMLENMFVELREKNANNGIKIDLKNTLVRNRIQRYSIFDRDTDDYKIIFSIDKSDMYYYFDPESGEFKKVNNLLDLISRNYIIISDELRRQMGQVENIEKSR